MKTQQIQLHAECEVRLTDIDLPAPGPGQVLVENETTALSAGTELAAYNGWLARKPNPTPYPFALGYCNVGRVLEVGPDVENISVGDRVVGQGPHAKHDVLREQYYRVPDGVEPEDAAFLVLAAVSLRGIRHSNIELGSSVAVVGMGLVGQFAASLAKLAGGLPVAGFDLDDARLAHATRRGADMAINSKRDAAPQQFDVVIEATGIPAVYPSALKLCADAGRFVALGTPRGTVEMEFFSDLHCREIQMHGAFQPATPPAAHRYYRWNMGRDRSLLLDLMARKRFTIADLISHRFAPADCAKAYELLDKDAGSAFGVVFDWGK